MHLYSRTVGVMGDNPPIDELLDSIVKKAIANKKIEIENASDSEKEYFEAQINEPMLVTNDSLKTETGGLTIRGLYNPKTEDFKMQFYFPYIVSTEHRYSLELGIERQADKEAYMVHCEEPKREVTPIFFLSNIVPYINKYKGKKRLMDKTVTMSALAKEGKIIFPVNKTEEQIKRVDAEVKKRSTLVDLALRGNQEAIESLTIDDYDMISDIYQRVKKEDVLSIVESSFIPSGLECDAYTIVGNIKDVKLCTNIITNEEVYYMTVECNGIVMNLGINRRDLYGLPQAGFRFVGQVWLQGEIYVGEGEPAFGE